MYGNLADSEGKGYNLGLADPDNVGGFALSYYWSSSQTDSSFAWFQNFGSGIPSANVNKSTTTFIVRAVRAF
jgi:hypothetical protein